MKIIFSHPTGNANVRAAAFGLLEENLLSQFYTSIASFPGGLLDCVSDFGPLSEIKRRGFHPKLEPKTKMWPWKEIGRLISSRFGISRLITHEKGFFCIDSVYEDLDRNVAQRLPSELKKGANIVYAYEDGAFYSFQAGKRLGLECYYDLPIGYWRSARRILEEEKEKRPEWASTIIGLNDSPAKLSKKDEELELANQIFVASQFTANTLKDFPGTLAPVKVIPYGFPAVYTNRKYSSYNRRPLKLLFVGSLSQRKGLAELFAAVESLRTHVELTLVGQKVNSNCQVLNQKLREYKWIPSLSNEKILKLMREQDVLIFPSLFEGFGLVITEAMSQGTPVITTNRTAGPDIICHRESGWLIEAGSTEALKNAIEEILADPTIVSKAGREAMETARKRPWEVYGRELADAISKRL